MGQYRIEYLSVHLNYVTVEADSAEEAQEVAETEELAWDDRVTNVEEL